MKNFLRYICVILVCVIMIIPPVSAFAVGSKSATNQSIKDKEAQIAQAKKEKDTLQSNMSNLQKIKKDLEAQKNNLSAYVVELDKNLEIMEQNIIELKNKILVKEGEITQSEEELAQALEVEENQRLAMIVRVKQMYEQGGSNVAGMLLNSEDFSDLLNKADFMEKIVEYDKKQWRLFMDNRHLVELCKEELELEKVLLDEAKVTVEQEQKNLEDLIAQKKADIEAYESDINNKEKAIAEYEKEIKAQNAEIKALEKAVEEERKRLLESNKKVVTYDGGTFKFPLKTYKRISDDYGTRMHPILKVEQFHNGIDFAADKGTDIYAAYDGVVVAAAYSSTMGNYIMIDHGDGLYTLYMHASVLYVKKDAVVTKGTTIAAVGSTGRSTGNHLHFSVRKNGAYVSPWNYISQ